MVAVSGCVVAGVGPISLSGSDREPLGNDGRNTPPLAKVAREVRPATTPQTAGSEAPEGGGDVREESPTAATEPEPPEEVLAPDTPPTAPEFGVESAAQPTGSQPAQTDPGSDAGAVAGEFGP